MRRLLFLSIVLVFAFQSAFAWSRAAGFEQGTLGAKAEGSDGFGGAAGYSRYTKNQVYDGAQACACSINAGQTGWGVWGGTINFPVNLTSGDELWYHIATYWPSDFDYNSYGEGGRLKFLRMRTKSPTNDNHGYDDIYINGEGKDPPFGFIYEGEQKWFMFGSGHGIERDKWETYEVYYKMHNSPIDSGGEAFIRIWKNGALLQEITARKTLKEATTIATAAYIFTYWNGASPLTQKMYVDNIILTTETPPNRDAQGNPMIGNPSTGIRLVPHVSIMGKRTGFGAIPFDIHGKLLKRTLQRKANGIIFYTTSGWPSSKSAEGGCDAGSLFSPN